MYRWKKAKNDSVQLWTNKYYKRNKMQQNPPNFHFKNLPHSRTRTLFSKNLHSLRCLNMGVFKKSTAIMSQFDFIHVFR